MNLNSTSNVNRNITAAQAINRNIILFFLFSMTGSCGNGFLLYLDSRIIPIPIPKAIPDPGPMAIPTARLSRAEPNIRPNEAPKIRPVEIPMDIQ